MDIRPIRSDADHAAALQEVERLWNAAPGTPEADKLDVLATLIEAYEARRFPLPPIDPIDFLKAHMEATGRTQSDLAALLGSKSRASEIMNRRRGFTIQMIRLLHAEWRLPAEALIASPHLVAAA
ncbi:helix-turn-helix domain-containing protein [Zavarzinia compransoris]|uniref:Transcriptional regulator n=1 Tax=Zavarzinia compransoris TaxID=1264899 RepID=A0A317E164_9PROT|nr:transcriptional regulator [Zavarzinia compransoris]PWR19103.1 transcriptional regulator [Zavarzinia compransoris]TDP49114.1 Xre family transcriptional regulator [Zavarzinia compransoris]